MKNDGSFPMQTLGVCDRTFCQRLQRTVQSIPSTLYPEKKAEYRQKFLEMVASTLKENNNRTVNIWLLDDFLFVDPSKSSTLTEQLIWRFGADRLRVFSPNLKANVVNHLCSLPNLPAQTVLSATGCACRFNEYFAEMIRCCGGLDVLMLDGFGGLENNVEALTRQMVTERLFRRDAGGSSGLYGQVKLMLVMSDLHDRAVAGSVIQATLKASIAIPKLFDNTAWTLTIQSHESYGRTMQVLFAHVRSRQWSEDQFQDFREETVLVERGYERQSKPDKTDCIQKAGGLRTPFMPYDGCKLRCNPMWHQLKDTHEDHLHTSINSRSQLLWKCSECDSIYLMSPHLMKRCTGRCHEHSKKLKKKNRPRYQGHVSQKASTFIRAALLSDFSKEDMLKCMLTEGIVHTEAEGCDCVNEISKFGRIDLLDNGFWWQDSMSRKSGDRYKRKSAGVLQELPRKRSTGKTHVDNTERTVCYWLPDYAHWAPVVRIVKHDQTLLLHMWLGHIHWRLFLPNELFFTPYPEEDDVGYNWILAVKLLRSLGKCLLPFFGEPQRPENFSAKITSAIKEERDEIDLYFFVRDLIIDINHEKALLLKSVASAFVSGFCQYANVVAQYLD